MLLTILSIFLVTASAPAVTCTCTCACEPEGSGSGVQVQGIELSVNPPSIVRKKLPRYIKLKCEIQNYIGEDLEVFLSYNQVRNIYVHAYLHDWLL